MWQPHACLFEIAECWVGVGWREATDAGEFSAVRGNPPPTALRINLRSGVSENLVMQLFKKLRIFLVLPVNFDRSSVGLVVPVYLPVL